MVYLVCQHAIQMIVMWYDGVVTSFELNVTRFQRSTMHVHYYYYPLRSVVQVKVKNDDI